MRRIFAWASRPWVSLVTGLFLVIASLADLRETIVTFADGLKAEHALALYGLVAVVKSLNDLQEGLENVSKSRRPERGHSTE